MWYLFNPLEICFNKGNHISFNFQLFFLVKLGFIVTIYVVFYLNESLSNVLFTKLFFSVLFLRFFKRHLHGKRSFPFSYASSLIPLDIELRNI